MSCRRNVVRETCRQRFRRASVVAGRLALRSACTQPTAKSRSRHALAKSGYALAESTADLSGKRSLQRNRGKFEGSIRGPDDASHGEEAVHLIAHMHERGRHIVIFQKC